jgi:hypothetical protein
VPEPSVVVKGFSPLDSPVNQPRFVVSVKGVPKAMTCGGDGDGSIGRYDGPSSTAAVGFLWPQQ